jgi:hypothetical protein
MRSNSARVIVCLVALVESSTMNVDRVLRESTRARTFTLPNSVTEAFGIFSVSSRSRSAVGFHSTDAALTCCPTVAPPPGRRPVPGPGGPASRRARSRAPYAARFGECTPAGANQLQTGCLFRRGGRADRRARRRKRCARTWLAPARAGGSGCVKPSPGASEYERKRPAHTARAAHSAAFGLDLWFKPLAVIHRWSRARPLGTNLFHLAQCVA